MRTHIIALSLLFASTFLQAQEFNAGLTGGIVASQLDGDKYAGYNKFGLQGGAYVNRFLAKKLSAQLSLLYKEMGSREDSEGLHYKCKLQYVIMPLTIRYHHFKKVDFEGGLSLGYLIKQYEEDNDGYEIDNPVEFNKFDFCWMVGLNYKFTEKFSIGVNFQYSIIEVRPYIPQNINLRKGQYNHAVGFSLAYQFSTWKI